MPGAITRFGKWRIKPSSNLPIYLRYVINSSFTPENARKSGFTKTLPNRIFINHMMYWPAMEYDAFEREIVTLTVSQKGWFERFCKQEMKRVRFLEKLGRKLEKVDWKKKTNRQLVHDLQWLVGTYNLLICPWYTQYPLDEYFEGQITDYLVSRLSANDSHFSRFVQIFTDPKDMIEVAWERYRLLLLARDIEKRKISFTKLPLRFKNRLTKHLQGYNYLNRGLATGQPYTIKDIIARLREMLAKKDLNRLISESSPAKLKKEYQAALKKVKPSQNFRKIITQAKFHSYLRNRRVEAFFLADYGASFMYAEIARRTKFTPDLIMQVSSAEMVAGLRGRSMPSQAEMKRRLRQYAMIVRNARTKLITDPKELRKLAQIYAVTVSEKKKELHGMVACRGYARGKARVFFDAQEMVRLQPGDILVAQFTTPDFVPAMEKAAAIVTDQGGVSSHAAIVSRELGVPCVIGTQEATRVIKEGDLLEVDAEHGIVRII